MMWYLWKPVGAHYSKFIAWPHATRFTPTKMESQQTDIPTASAAVSFSVDFGEPAKKHKRRMPRNLSSELRNHKKKEVTQAALDEKQRLAEERRKKHIDDRIERIHQLEEEAMSLARAMDPLIQASKDQKLPNGPTSHQVHSNAVQAAKEVASMNSKVIRSLDVDNSKQ